MKVITLSPSDFAYLYKECKRCFYMKAMLDFRRPRTPMPNIFNVIDTGMKNAYEGKLLKEIDPRMPDGKVVASDGWVRSVPIVVSRDPEVKIVLRGKFDTVVQLDDGSYGVIDFKTTKIRDEARELYARQLHGYAWGLEQAQVGENKYEPISTLGLVVYEPQKYVAGDNGAAALHGPVSWLKIERDDAKFKAFLKELAVLFALPEPPEADPECEFCRYHATQFEVVDDEEEATADDAEWQEVKV